MTICILRRTRGKFKNPWPFKFKRHNLLITGWLQRLYVKRSFTHLWKRVIFCPWVKDWYVVNFWMGLQKIQVRHWRDREESKVNKWCFDELIMTIGIIEAEIDSEYFEYGRRFIQSSHQNTRKTVGHISFKSASQQLSTRMLTLCNSMLYLCTSK